MSATPQHGAAGLVVVGEKHYSDSRPANGHADESSVGAMRPINEERGTGTTPFAAAASQEATTRRSGSGVPLLRVSSAPSSELYRYRPGPDHGPRPGPDTACFLITVSIRSRVKRGRSKTLTLSVLDPVCATQRQVFSIPLVLCSYLCGRMQLLLISRNSEKPAVSRVSSQPGDDPEAPDVFDAKFPPADQVQTLQV